MNSKRDLSIIIPAYLEEENLRLLLPRLHVALQKLNILYEIIVVDTMQPMDDTQKVCQLNNVRYVNRLNGNYFGDAVRTGIAYSTGGYVIFMDGDGSHSPEFIPTLYQYRNEYDVIVASRYIAGGTTENTLLLILMSKILNAIYAFILGIHCRDISNSFKLYSGEMLRSLTLKCNNFDIVEEIFFKLTRKNAQLKIKEVPFVFKKRLFGKTKRNLFLFIVTYIISLIYLRFSIYFEK